MHRLYRLRLYRLRLYEIVFSELILIAERLAYASFKVGEAKV